MKNKKLIALIILSIAAVVSLIYGITSSTKGKGGREVRSPAVPEPAERLKMLVPSERKPKRSGYITWGRNPFAKKQAPVIKEVAIVLNGIMWDENNPIAIINNDMVGIGDRVAGNTVVDIKKDRVILNDGTKDFEIKLMQ